MNDRQAIVAEIESSVSAEVDRAIQILNALLEGTPEVEVVPADDSVESVTELLENATPEPPPKAAPRSRKTGTKKTSPEATGKSSQPQAFDAKRLKRKFKGKSLREAIVQVMQQDSAQIYTSDDLMAALYDQFDEAEISRARKTLGATLMHSVRAGTVERIGEKPSHYKLGQAAGVSA